MSSSLNKFGKNAEFGERAKDEQPPRPLGIIMMLVLSLVAIPEVRSFAFFICILQWFTTNKKCRHRDRVIQTDQTDQTERNLPMKLGKGFVALVIAFFPSFASAPEGGHNSHQR